MSNRILIVEDENHIGIGIKFNCEAEGYEATLVDNGPTALKLFEDDAGAFDLVILDLMLPGMSGYTVLERLRGSGNHVPVLILSARTLPEDKVRGFDAGADQYITKPFELPELLSRVNNLLSRRSSASQRTSPADTFDFNDAHIDFTRHEVTVRGEQLELTTKEMELLKFFIQHEGVVLSRNDLLDNVWGMDASPATRTVDNFLVRLRRYFERDPAQPEHFVSVRGVGYRFIAQPPGLENR